MTKYATIAAAARRWGVNRATARAAIQSSGIEASALHASPRYEWSDLLHKIEGWPLEVTEYIDESAVLSCATDLADRLGVTPQTIRNYGKSGRIKAIRIASRAVRYALNSAVEHQGEGKSESCCKR